MKVKFGKTEVDCKQVSVSVSRTFNLGNYESLKAEVTMSGDVLSGEMDQVVAAMLPELRKGLVLIYDDYVGPTGKRLDL